MTSKSISQISFRCLERQAKLSIKFMNFDLYLRLLLKRLYVKSQGDNISNTNRECYFSNKKITHVKDENQLNEFYKDMFGLCNRVMFFKMAEQDPSRLSPRLHLWLPSTACRISPPLLLKTPLLGPSPLWVLLPSFLIGPEKRKVVLGGFKELNRIRKRKYQGRAKNF